MCWEEGVRGGGGGGSINKETSVNSPIKRQKRMTFGRSNSSNKEKDAERSTNFNSKRSQKISDPGYFTFRRPVMGKAKNKPKAKKMSHRFSMKPQKMMSVAAEISSPSSVVKTSSGSNSSIVGGGGASSSTAPTTPVGGSPEAGSLTRQTAFRSKRGTRISRGFSTEYVIPEASFNLEISKVNVLFKSTKMEVPCKGEERGREGRREGEECLSLSLL